MSDHKFQKTREALLARKQELEEHLEQLAHEPVSDEQVQDSADQAVASTMEALRHSLQDAELEEYHKIVKALQKIDDGSYGICGECGNPIAEKRLRLYPNATRCIGCQEALEGQGNA